MVKNFPAMQETWVQSLGLEDPPGEGNGNPLHRGAWRATVQGVTKSPTQLNMSTYALCLVAYVYGLAGLMA